MINLRGCGVERLGGRVKLLELSGPVAGPGQIVVAVTSAGVGAWDPLLPGSEWDVGLRPPAAMGVEGAGVVVAPGAGVARFAVGDAVLAHEAPLPGGSGFWADLVVVDAAYAARCPPHLDIASAGALPVSGLTARQAVDALGLESFERVLVTGAGTTGSLIVQVAALAGLAETTTASPSSVESLRSIGASDVIDYRDADWPAIVEHAFDAAVVSAPARLPTRCDAFVTVGGSLHWFQINVWKSAASARPVDFALSVIQFAAPRRRDDGLHATPDRRPARQQRGARRERRTGVRAEGAVLGTEAA
jgi:NADPH:quinone reductase-like Zn-dependent oxidoreductase